MQGGTAKGSVWIGDVSVSIASTPESVPQSVFEVPDEAVQQATQQAYDCLHNR